MPTCDICTLATSKKSVGVLCTKCGKNFHANCVGVDSGSVENLKKPGAFWMCASCRKNARKSVQTLDQVSDDDVLNVRINPAPASSADLTRIFSALQDIRMDIKSLSTKYEELTKCVSFCSDKISEFDVKLAGFAGKIVKFDKLAAENVELKHTLAVLQVKVEEADQYSRSNSIEIRGIPESKDEDIYKVVGAIATGINCVLDNSVIDVAHRVSSFNNEGSESRPIVVKLLSRRNRDAILSAAKLTRSTSENKSPGLLLHGFTKPVFISEHLTLKNKILYKKSRDLAKINQFKYVWVKNGSIFVRKSDNDRAFSVRCDADLRKFA